MFLEFSVLVGFSEWLFMKWVIWVIPALSEAGCGGFGSQLGLHPSELPATCVVGFFVCN